MQIKLIFFGIVAFLLLASGFFIGYKMFNKVCPTCPVIASKPIVHSTSSTVSIKPSTNSNCPEVVVTNGTVSSMDAVKPIVASKEAKPRVSIGAGLNKATVPSMKQIEGYYLEGGIRVIDEVWVKSRYRHDSKEFSIGIEYRF
jgi:hypothetical protein